MTSTCFLTGAEQLDVLLKLPSKNITNQNSHTKIQSLHHTFNVTDLSQNQAMSSSLASLLHASINALPAPRTCISNNYCSEARD